MLSVKRCEIQIAQRAWDCSDGCPRLVRWGSVVKDSKRLLSFNLPLQLTIVEGVGAIQRSADSLLSHEGQSLHLGSDVLLHAGVLLSCKITLVNPKFVA